MTLSFDTETHLIAPGRKVPPLVCMATPTSLYSRRESVEVAAWLLDESNDLLTNHNMAFDVAVLGNEEPYLLPKFFDAYERDQIACTMVRQKLIDNAYGRLSGWTWGDQKNKDGTPKRERLTYSLAAVAKRLLGIHVEKENTWRLRYAELEPYPIAQWPREAVEYPIKDAGVALAVHTEQDKAADCLVDQYRQARASFWLTLMSAWGFHTDARQVRALADAARSEQRYLLDVLVREGLLRAPRAFKSGPRKGQFTEPSRDTKRAHDRIRWAYSQKGLPVPTTPTSEPCLDETACLESGDPVLKMYARYSSISARLSKDVPMLEEGVRMPIQCRYDELKENGRTGSAGPNAQNWPREQGDDHPKEGPTVRECAVPRAGYVFAAADYEQMELHTLAQVCIKLVGFSKLADALNAGRDPHLEMGARILGISFDEAKARLKAGDKAVKNARQASKPINFGLPGGLGAERMVEYAKNNYKVILTIDQARSFKSIWFQQWPEMKPYLALIGRLVEAPDAQIEQLFSGRKRGGLDYCNTANTFFSGLAQDAAKEAGWRIARACYIDTSSILWGSRPIIFGHDEFIAEVPEFKAHECATELARLMVEAGKNWLPDVHPKAAPLLMRNWSKDAEAIKDANGRLIPWEPSTRKAG